MERAPRGSWSSSSFVLIRSRDEERRAHRSAPGHGGDDLGGGTGIEVEAARPSAGPPPVPLLTPAYAAKKRELDARNFDDTEAANCLPTGMPAIMGHPYPYEFLLTPGKVTIISEAYMQVRHIYTDGRPLPADPDPTFNGTSIGRWDGTTLVVETIGFSPLTTIARNTPHSDKMRITERFRLTGPDTMSIETTVIDPEAFDEAVAWPHHAAAPVFDMNAEKSVAGVVKQVDWTNPHIWIWLDVQNASGQMDTWGFEGMSFRPLRDGRAGGMFMTGKLDDGKVLTSAGAQ